MIEATPLLFVHSNLGLGGAEVLREMVCRELDARGIAFRVCVTSQAPEEVVGWQGLRHRLDFLRRPNAFWRIDTTRVLAAYLRRHRPRVVQSGQFLSNWHCRWSKPAGALLVTEEHGFNDWMKGYHRALDRLAAPRSDAILAVSGAVAAHVRERLGPRHPPVEVLHNPVDPALLDAPDRRAQTRRRLGLGEGLVIGTLGTLRGEKAHDVLLQAVALLRDLDPTLLVVGDGPRAPALRAQAAQLGIGDQVVWHGRDTDRAGLLDAMDLFAFPSRSEGLGIALLEAMGRGRAVVAAATGGIPEVVKDGVTGRLVPVESPQALAAALRALWLSAQERARLGAAARQHVAQHHDLRRYVDALLEWQARLLADPRPAAA